MFVFFGLARVDAESASMVIKRFFMLPHFVACLCSFYFLGHIAVLTRFARNSLVCSLLFLVVWQSLETKRYLEEVSSKDYAAVSRDLLRTAELAKSEVLFTQGDTEFYAVVFEASVRKSSVVIATFDFWMMDWYQKKLSLIFPNIKLPDTSRRVGPLHVDHEIFVANLGRVRMLSSFSIPNLGLFHQKYYLPGVEILPGVGRSYADFDLTVLEKLDPPPYVLSGLPERSGLRMRYILPLTTFARDELSAGRFESAARSIEAAMRVLPESQVTQQMACTAVGRGYLDKKYCQNEKGSKTESSSPYTVGCVD